MDLPEKPPVRASVDDMIAGRLSYEICSKIEVMLDGVVQKNVVEYDCEAGTVLVLANDEDGNFFATADGSEIAKESICGNVTVRWEGEPCG